jgi:phosphomannomutase
MSIIRFDNKGWRARFDDGFNEQNVSRIADAFAYIWADAHPGATVIVGYDTRYNGRGYAALVAGVIASYGLRVLVSSSECPTPALGWAVSQDPMAVGGVMLTASSASCEYGGISARGADGGPVSEDFYDAAARIVSSMPVTSRGTFSYADIVDSYLQHLKDMVDVSIIEAASLEVVVDPMYGSARGYLAALLRSLGCRVHEIHDDSNPDFGGLHPSPTEPWIDTCEQAVTVYGADLGLVLDGDGDRFGAIDKYGRFVSPHKTVPLIMEHLVKDKGEWGRVVVTHSCSAYVRRQADRLGCELTTVPMGFTRIYGEFVEHDVLLGAEEYGGVAIPSHLAERDGLLASLMLVEYMAQSGCGLHELVEDLRRSIGNLHYIRRDIKLDVASIQSFRNILPGLNIPEVCGMRPVAVGHSDGLILRFANDSWVQLRPSRTEAYVRSCAEAPDLDMANRLANETCEEALKYLPV